MEKKDAIKNAFDHYKKTELNLDEIVEYVYSIPDFSGGEKDDLRKSVGSIINNDLKRTVKGKRIDDPNSVFVNVKGKNGVNRKGIYKLRPLKPGKNPINPDKKKATGDLFSSDTSLKRQKEVSSTPSITLTPPVLPKVFDDLSTIQIGKGGEFTVVSELLFRGFNANIMTVDDGVDICAAKEKDGKFFLIQVKTTSCEDNVFQVNIDKNSYSRYNVSNMYYIIVVRFVKDRLPQNQYLIFNSFDIEKLVSIGLASDSQKYFSMKFKIWNGDIRIVRQGKDDSVMFHLNNWGWIK